MMRRLAIFFGLILCSAALTFAEGQPGSHDDHNDGGPIQTGYGVVTPVTAGTGGTTSGLVVFETFGLRNNGNGTTQAGVLPPNLTTNAVLFVDDSGRLSKSLGVAVANPNSSNVNLTMTLRKNDGTQLATTTVNVPSHHQVSKFVTDLFANQSAVPSDITGTLVITSAGSSNLPVSAIGLRFRGANFSTIPVTDLSGNTGALPSIAAGVGGAGAVLLPQFAAGGGWATEIVMLNTGVSALTVRVDLFQADGTALKASLNGTTASSFTNLIIPAGGVLTLAPRNVDGDDDF
jgi:hypothetical protein